MQSPNLSSECNGTIYETYSGMLSQGSLHDNKGNAQIEVNYTD